MRADAVLRGPPEPDTRRPCARFGHPHPQVQHAIARAAHGREGIDHHQLERLGAIERALRIEDRRLPEAITRLNGHQSRHIGRIEARTAIAQRLDINLNAIDGHDRPRREGQRQRGLGRRGINGHRRAGARGTRITSIAQAHEDPIHRAVHARAVESLPFQQAQRPVKGAPPR